LADLDHIYAELPVFDGAGWSECVEESAGGKRNWVEQVNLDVRLIREQLQAGAEMTVARQIAAENCGSMLSRAMNDRPIVGNNTAMSIPSIAMPMTCAPAS